MYAININIAFTFTIIKQAATPPGNIDLVFVDPNGLTIFYSAGTEYGAVYTPPTEIDHGSYKFTRSFPIPGKWAVILADGASSSSYTILKDWDIRIEKSLTTYDKSFSLPV